MLIAPPSTHRPIFTGHIGVAREDITPPVGIYCRNWGAATHDAAEGIHRPLTLNVLSLQREPNGTPCVLVEADLGWWRSLETERRFREQVLQELSLNPSRFIFALSHTHSSPPLADPEPEWEGGELLPAFIARVRDATLVAAREALRSAQPATLDWHTGRCSLATNRDLPDPTDPTDSTDKRQVCGYSPEVPADDTLVVGRVTDSHGRILATLTNYACHPTTLAWENCLVSPDYVGAMRETLQQHTRAPAMFLQGASGDLAPKYQYVADTSVADAHGRQLAYATLATLEDMDPPNTRLVFDRVVESGAPLAVWKREPVAANTALRSTNATVDLPLKDWPSAEELERQRQGCTDRALQERLRRRRDIRRVLGDGKTFALPIHVWQVGDAVLAGNMCECYSWMQQELRHRIPDILVVFMNLVNGSIGYLPPAERYDQDCYQVWQTPFARGSLEALSDAVESTIQHLIAEDQS
ncbi:MAG: alkaline ceramidase [Armatimonadetes bacterium CG07_land_8_20_14_0_80_59_28]|nr:MAG: alkaline ceramidase [Armatimonadetes bacterium CG07_land_8_20_14_0_80_59_28]PIX42149.1 MAG: alkaline ceramidase [Armatimonadetes bacterium CG_4_8_14_3_um_filter_58_9]